MRIISYLFVQFLALVSSVTLADQRDGLQALHYEPIVKRQSCPTNYFSCANLGAAFNGICCFSGSSCALDALNNPACCPTNAVCTGTAPPAVQTGVAGGVSFVNNPYYPFPYITTSFANAAACTAAVNQCQDSYNNCVLGLEGLRGPGYQVTISVAGGGGTTVAGPQVTLAPTSAVSVCTSLSSVACFNLQPTQCAQIGGNGGVVVGGGRRFSESSLLRVVLAVGVCLLAKDGL